MSAALLTTKLSVPPLRTTLVSRPHLIEQLDAAVQHRLTLISAPAGFGKTTLLTEWIHSGSPSRDALTTPIPVGWLALDEGDNDPTRFWSYVLAALDTLQPGLGKDARALLQSPQPLPIEVVLTSLLNEITALPSPSTTGGRAYVLILDDYHAITAQSIHAGLSFLTEQSPPQLRLVVSTRSDPPLPLARLRARNQLVELRIDALRFTPDEAATFLNQVMALGLQPDHVTTLEERTEGWIAGLQLAALSLQGKNRQQTSAFIANFSGSHRFIEDYLVEEVLHRQPEALQDFLLKSSILDRMTAPLCDAVCYGITETPAERKSSQTVLESLDQANLFVVPLDAQRRWYRYHRLFADLLRARLEERGSAAPLHRRAAGWYEDNGFRIEAVGHALKAEDWPRAASLIEQSAQEMLWRRGEVATFLRWLQELPEEVICSQPGLCLLEGWALFLSVRLQDAASRIEDAERALEKSSPPQEHRQEIRNQIAVMQAMLANFQGDIPRTIQLSRQALQLVPRDNLFLRGSLAGNLGGAYGASGDALAAKQAFAESSSLFERTGNTFIVLIARAYLASAQLTLGELQEASHVFRQVLELAAGHAALQSLGARMAYIGLGSVLYEWNDLQEAEKLLQSGMMPGAETGDLSLGPGQTFLIDGYLTLAKVQQARGNLRQAAALLEKAARSASELDPAEPGRVSAAQARLALIRGDLAAARRWAQASGLSPDDKLDHRRESEVLTLARLLLLQAQTDRALALLEHLRQESEAGQRMGTVIEALLLQALVFQAKNERRSALSALEQSLVLAEPEGYMRLFLDEGPAVAELLPEVGLGRAAIDPGYLANLQAAFNSAGPDDTLSLVEPLTGREREVLLHIAAGLSNRQIAEELVITVTTVKKHAGNIYGKLGVQSRTQAVARASELGLLPSHHGARPST